MIDIILIALSGGAHSIPQALAATGLDAGQTPPWVLETILGPARVIALHLFVTLLLRVLGSMGAVSAARELRLRRGVAFLAGAGLIASALWPFLWAHAPSLAISMLGILAALALAGTRRVLLTPDPVTPDPATEEPLHHSRMLR